MQQNGGMIFGLGQRFCGNDDETADLMQETLLESFKSCPSFRGDAKATTSTWLYRIVARTCQQMHEKNSPGARKLPSDDIVLDQCGLAWRHSSEIKNPLEDAVRGESQQRLEAAIFDLPIEYRMPLLLKEIVG